MKARLIAAATALSTSFSAGVPAALPTGLTLSAPIVIRAVATVSVIAPTEALAKKKPRKAVKKRMTQAERTAYRTKKRDLNTKRKAAKVDVKARGNLMISASKDAVRYGSAALASRKALDAQKKRLDAAKARTGLFKPSAKKLASMKRRYNKAVNDYNNGPRAAYNNRATAYNQTQTNFANAKVRAANAISNLAQHRMTVDGRLGGPAAPAAERRAVHGSFMKFTKNELNALDYGKIPDLKQMSEYARAPVPQSIYGGVPDL